MNEKKRAGDHYCAMSYPPAEVQQGSSSVILIASRNMQKSFSKLKHFLNVYYATSIKSAEKATIPL
jgi:hypothetical protein